MQVVSEFQIKHRQKKVLNNRTVKSTQRQKSICPWPAQKGYKSQSGHLLPAGKKPVSRRRDRDARRLPSHVAATTECFRDLGACCPMSSVNVSSNLQTLNLHQQHASRKARQRKQWPCRPLLAVHSTHNRISYPNDYIWLQTINHKETNPTKGIRWDLGLKK